MVEIGANLAGVLKLLMMAVTIILIAYFMLR